MRKKREEHDKVVEKFKSKEFLEENVSLFQKNIYSVQNMFRNDDEKKLDEDEDDEEEDYEPEMNDDDTIVKNFDDEDLVIKITNNAEESDQKKDNKKTKNRNGVSKKVEKRKNRQIIDTEHFIPYKPKNFNQEKA
jgi:hypothetical protein